MWGNFGILSRMKKQRQEQGLEHFAWDCPPEKDFVPETIVHFPTLGPWQTPTRLS